MPLSQTHLLRNEGKNCKWLELLLHLGPFWFPFKGNFHSGAGVVRNQRVRVADERVSVDVADEGESTHHIWGFTDPSGLLQLP